MIALEPLCGMCDDAGIVTVRFDDGSERQDDCPLCTVRATAEADDLVDDTDRVDVYADDADDLITVDLGGEGG